MIPRLYRGAVELSAFAASAAAIGPPRRTTQFTGTINLANIGEVFRKAPGALIAGMFARHDPVQRLAVGSDRPQEDVRHKR